MLIIGREGTFIGKNVAFLTVTLSRMASCMIRVCIFRFHGMLCIAKNARISFSSFKLLFNKLSTTSSSLNFILFLRFGSRCCIPLVHLYVIILEFCLCLPPLRNNIPHHNSFLSNLVDLILEDHSEEYQKKDLSN